MLFENGWTPGEKKPSNLKISTGSPGGTYVKIGEQMVRVLERHRGKRIGTIESDISQGTLENLERLSSGEADFGLVVGPVWASDPRRAEIHGVMALYTDVLQVVVRRDSGIKTLRDLKGKTVYLGPPESGTRWIATRALAAAGVLEADIEAVTAFSFNDAAELLRSNRADAAFFVTGIPVDAVAGALASGCCVLLDLWDHLAVVREEIPDLVEFSIPAYVYGNQTTPVRTLGARAILVARADLDPAIVEHVLGVGFDNIGELALTGPHLQEIRLDDRAFDVPATLHAGARSFLEKERSKLLIATGSIRGRYYRIGKRIQEVLNQNNIPSRLIHTDGAVENLRLLAAGDRPVLAITQYDTALASYWSPEIYQAEGVELGVPAFDGLRRIVALDVEKLHVLMRGDRVPAAHAARPTVSALEGKLVSVGPPGSGTQVMARALLHHDGTKPDSMLSLAVGDMVARMRSGEIDGVFLVSYAPSELLKSIAHDDQYRFLSVEPGSVGKLVGEAIRISTIDPKTYGTLRRDEPPIDTITTRSVLVTSKDVRVNIAKVTQLLFRAAGYIGIEGSAKAMAADLGALPLHPDAEAHYRKTGFLARVQTFPERIVTWLQSSWYVATILVIVVGLYRGCLKYRRDRMANEIGRRILAVSTDPDAPEPVRKLLEIREEIRERVRRRWWRFGELDKPRWRHLDDLIQERIEAAREKTTTALAAEIRQAMREPGIAEYTDNPRILALRQRVWDCFQRMELDPSQMGLLLGLIGEGERVE